MHDAIQLHFIMLVFSVGFLLLLFLSSVVIDGALSVLSYFIMSGLLSALVVKCVHGRMPHLLLKKTKQINLHNNLIASMNVGDVHFCTLYHVLS